jgi:hypothetical protein
MTMVLGQRRGGEVGDHPAELPTATAADVCPEGPRREGEQHDGLLQRVGGYEAPAHAGTIF